MLAQLAEGFAKPRGLSTFRDPCDLRLNGLEALSGRVLHRREIWCRQGQESAGVGRGRKATPRGSTPRSRSAKRCEGQPDDWQAGG